jgi:phosphatidylinositol alpha-1,6-mannosyltransferase
MAPLALVLAQLMGAKLVVQTHGIEVWDRPTRSQRAALEAADLVLSVSRDTRRNVLSWSSGPAERIVVLPNTVGDQFTPGDGRAVRRRMGLATQKLLLSVSRLDAGQRYKGQDCVIPLIAPLVSKGHDVVYLIGGVGDDRARLEQLASDHGVAERVRFLGAVPDDELVELYRAVDIYLMPSSGEGFGIVFLEAMACGAPAMGLALGGARDALADGELGKAASEDELLGLIDTALRAERPDGRALAERVRSRFGKRIFEARVAEVAEAFL